MSKEAAVIESLLSTLDTWLVVFAIIVAIGVTGEAIFGFIHWRKGDQLREVQRQENLAQEKEIERLKLEAETLKLRTVQTVAALKQPTLTEDDQKLISEKVRSCARPDVKVVVEFGVTSTFGIQLWKALHDGGFTSAEPIMRRDVWYGTSIKGPMDMASVTGCISTALMAPKKFALMGAMGVSEPPGSPITISVGENPMGKLPE